jgi:hypothetical protein
MSPFLLPFVFCACEPVSDFAIYVTDKRGAGSVRLCTENSSEFSTHPWLHGLRLLDCVPASRTPLDESFAARAHLRTDLEQGTRVELPGGRGSVYHYQRAGPGGSCRFGFFAIDAAAQARVLIELPSGPDASDPFLESLASEADGSSLLVATQPAAGGDLWQLFLDGSPALDRTEGIAPQVFGRDSCFLSASLGAAVSTTGVLRFDPASNDCAETVGFGVENTPAWLGLELMPSAGGAFVALIAGDSPLAARPFVVGAAGPVQCRSALPDVIPGAGCLPEAQNGPWLAVSDDGELCAWRVGDSHGYTYSRELFLARHDPEGQDALVHVTRDGVFEPYIDEIGLVFFRPDRQLVFLAGDPGANGSLLSRADLFCATLDGGGGLGLSNLSRTSGEGQPPFLSYGTLEPLRLRVQAESGRALLYGRDPAGHQLLQVDPDSSGAQLVESGVEELGLIEPDGGEWIVGMDVPGSGGETGLCQVEVEDQVEIQILLDLPSFGGATRTLHNPFEGDWFACICAEGPIEHAWQVDVSHGTVRQFSTNDLVFGRSMAYTPSGALILSVLVQDGASMFMVWPGNGPPHALWPVPQAGFVLPGA